MENQVNNYNSVTKKTSSALMLIFVLILLAGNIVLGFLYYFSYVRAQDFANRVQAYEMKISVNSSVLDFNKLFVEKVLKMTGEVSYEDRLRLETAVDETNDPEIKLAWQAFLASKTEQEAQARVLDLLTLFPDKILY